MTFTKENEKSFIVNIYNDKNGFIVKESKRKLINFFIEIEKCKRLLCFVDRRFENGQDLKNLGFNFLFATIPNTYLWNFKHKKQKETLEKTFEILRNEKNMRDQTRIFDCGSLIFEKTYF